MKRNLLILGSTGSVGRNAVEVARRMRDRISICGLAAGSSCSELAAQVDEVGCPAAAIADSRYESALRNAVSAECKVFSGAEGLIELCSRPEVDIVLCAISGTAGLRPVLAAIKSGKDIALASKEILVMAGGQIMASAREHGVQIIPVDSEHSAVFQCLQGESEASVERLILTASGGPFHDFTAQQLEKVTPEQALAHPTWNMGPKITIDSATMMNKGLELIEACWLFQVEPERIDVVVHPQSIVHSMVEMRDGSVLAQLGNPDMRLPIQYAFNWPERGRPAFSRLSLDNMRELQFYPPRERLFPAIRLSRQAAVAGGTLPAVFNAANEVAVEVFRDGLISFPEISRLVEDVMEAHSVRPISNIGVVLEADAWARDFSRKMIG